MVNADVLQHCHGLLNIGIKRNLHLKKVADIPVKIRVCDYGHVHDRVWDNTALPVKLTYDCVAYGDILYKPLRHNTAALNYLDLIIHIVGLGHGQGKPAYDIGQSLLGRKGGDGYDQGTALQEHPADVLSHLKLLGKAVGDHQGHQKISGAFQKAQMDRVMLFGHDPKGQIDDPV